MGTSFVLVIGLVLAGLGFAGQVARRRLARRYRPTGRLVDIGGYRLHVDVRGSSGPTIVLEGGTWAPGLTWRPLQEQLSRFARVVSYDRAGLGWSDRSPRPRTAPIMADELHELLGAAGIPGPYLLVGHSFGGTIVRVFAHRWPEQTLGVVLLDGAHEDQFRRFPAPIRAMNERMAKAMPIVFGLLGLAARAGFLALRPSLVPAALGPLPDDLVAAFRALVAADPRVLGAMRDEMTSLEQGNDEVRRLAITTLGALPLAVVSHGRPEGVPPSLGPDIAAEYERVWQELQVEQAALSTRSRRQVAAGVGHNIPAEAPDLVVDAVRDVLAQAGPTQSAQLAAESVLAESTRGLVELPQPLSA